VPLRRGDVAAQRRREGVAGDRRLKLLWPTGGLWRHPDFLKLWSAESISQVGSQITQLALPLVAVLVLDASAFAVSALFVVEFLPFILFAIPAGVWVDRLPRRPILIAADLGRAALLGSIPLAYALDALTMGQLYVVGFLTGICTVFFDVSYQSYLPSLVERDRLVEGNSKLEISRSTSALAGPGLGGGLVGAVGAPAAILLDAISFVCSAGFLFRIRKREVLPSRPDGASKPSMLKEAREGLGYVLRHPYLRPISMCTASSNFCWSMVSAILVVYAVRELDMSPVVLGLMFSLSNVGPLLAALTANRLSARIGVGPTILWSSVGFGSALVLVPLAPRDFPLPLLVTSFLISGYASVAYNITQVSLRQAITPERMQGRMNSVIRFMVWGTLPLGGLLGGALGTWLGLREAMWIASVGGFLTFLPIALSRVRSIGEMPAPVEEPTLGEVALEAPAPP
jgi:MFS family permease